MTASDLTTHPGHAPDPDAAWLAKLAVLYVEDDAQARAQLAVFLKRRVGTLFEAQDGLEGLERFRSLRPAIVITDIQMPKLDGLGMVEEIRRLDAGVPVIVTTAFEQVDYLWRSIEAGVDKYVTKPVNTARLEAALLACAHRLRTDALVERERKAEADRQRGHEREALSLLAGGLAHDFNNLLQSVLFDVEEAMTTSPHGSGQREVLFEVQDALGQMRDLARSLNTLSERWPADLRVRELGPSLRAALAGALAGSATALRLDLPPELPPVPHDPELLRQAFEELVQNAREAMTDGGVLSVEGRPRAVAEGEVPLLAAGRYLEVTFRDTGHGIAPEVLPKVFDPYFTTKQRGAVRGMGLGLALCLAIVRKHRGAVTAAAGEHGGAVFTVLLPVDPQR